MSSAHDILGMIWRDNIAPQIKDDELVRYFGEVLESIHEADHNQGNKINASLEVQMAVRGLANYSRQIKK